MLGFVVINFLAAGIFGYTGHRAEETPIKYTALFTAALFTLNAIAFGLYT